MKKYLLITLVLIVSLSLFSCSTKVENNTAEETVTNETTNNVQGDVETSNETETAYTLEKGKVVPDLNMLDLDGNKVLLSDYRGKIIMLNFWATWCTYCDQEMPDLETVNGYDDVVVLAVNVREPKELVEEYLTEGGYTFDVVLDEAGDLATTFLVNSFPTTYFINEEGVLLGSVPGMMELDRMDFTLEEIRNKNLN